MVCRCYDGKEDGSGVEEADGSEEGALPGAVGAFTSRMGVGVVVNGEGHEGEADEEGVAEVEGGHGGCQVDCQSCFLERAWVVGREGVGLPNWFVYFF